MEYYEGPIDVYDADGRMVTSSVSSLLELDEDGTWWGRLRSEAGLPDLPEAGMISLPNGNVGHVTFTGELGADIGGADLTNIDFRGDGPAPFGSVDQEA